MCHPFLPTVFLLVLPIAYFANRIGALRSAALRWTIGGLLTGVAALEFPFSGLGEPYVAYLKMLISVSMAAWTVVRGRGFDGQALERRTRALVVGMAMASVCVSWDFFAFHGNHALIHYPEFTHYYLGSKYFPELGYGSLYTAMLEAEQESTGALSVEEARDLSTNHVVPASDLLTRAGAVKARFTPDRWSQFSKDAEFFRRNLGPLYATAVTDHGFNPSPVWALFGGAIANLVPATSIGVHLLANLDFLLEAVALGAIAATFGVELALVAVVYFCVIYGASFDWLGGAYLRYMWFCSLVLAACALKLGCKGLAGSLLALATMLRVFPGFFAVGIAFKALGFPGRQSSERAAYVRFIVAFASTALGLFVLTLASGEGMTAWIDFVRNVSTHSQSLSSNFVGLTNPVLYSLRAIGVIPEDVSSFLEWRRRITLIQVMALLPLGVALIWRARERLDDVSALAVGGLLMVIAVNLAAYYCSFLVVVMLSRRRNPVHVAMMFFAEFVTYFMQLFEKHPVVLFWYRGAILFYLLSAVFCDDLRPPPKGGRVDPTLVTETAR